MEARKEILDELKVEIPELIAIEGGIYTDDIPKDVINTFKNGLAKVGDSPTVQMQDDIILCDNFKEKCLNEINKRPDEVILFFSMRKADLTEGSRYDNNFLMNQCVYFPKGYAKQLLDFSRVWEEQNQGEDADDFLVRDFLRARKEKYYIVVPNLVNHKEVKSVINPRRSSKRQSKTFD